MKIAFIHKGFEDLGIEALSAYIKQKGHQVKLFYDGSTFSSHIGLDNPLLSKLFDLDPEEFKRRVVDDLRTSPVDVIGFSCTTLTYPWSLEMARTVKMELGLPVIFGGAHPSAVPEYVLKEDAVDVVVRGEGEETLEELLETFSGNEFKDRTVRNAAFRKNGEIIINPCRPYLADLDALPFQDKDLFNDKIDAFFKYYNIMSGRGCPYQCTYCGQSVYHQIYAGEKNHVRRRSPENVVAELERAKARREIRYVSFRDDIFTLDVKWLREFAEKYPSRVGIPFFCYSHSSMLNEEDIDLLAKSGCIQIKIGIQSFSREMCKKVLHRPLAEENMFRLKDRIKQAGIELMFDHILCLPGETEAELEDAVEKYIELQPDSITSFHLVYFPRTKIIDIAIERGLLSPDFADALNQGRVALEYSRPSPEDLKKCPDKFKIEYYFDLIPLLPKSWMRWIFKRRMLHKIPYSNYIRQVLLVIHDLLKRDIRLRYFLWYILARKNFP